MQTEQVDAALNPEIEKAIEQAKGQEALGAICGRTQQTVSHWRKRGQVPQAQAEKIQAHFKGLGINISVIKLMNLSSSS